MRLFFLLLLSFLSLLARDNPFFPTDPNEKQMQTTNKVQTLKPYSTQQISLPNSARAVKAIIIRYQNLDGSISTEELIINNEIDWHEPFIISQKMPSKTINGQTNSPLIDAKFIKFQPAGKSLKVVTKDKILRNFMLTSPNRIVMDFSRDTSFKPKNFNLNDKPFKTIRMGNHDKYYRVVVELDGQYKYKLQTNEKDYTIVCY